MFSHRAAIFLVVLLTGCSTNFYEVTLRPAGDSLERELVCWEEGGGRSLDDERPSEDKITTMSTDELRRIAAVYKTEVPKAAPVKHRFAGKFTGLLPSDIGGAGSYTRWTSPLGDLFVYVERVRGNDDPLADLDARRAALNGLLDALAAWLDVELKGDPALPKLRAFVAGPLRRDAANIMAILWSAGPALSAAEGEDEAGVVLTETFLRCGQYLVERGYFEPRDVPAFVRSARDANWSNDPVAIRAIIIQAIARKVPLAPGESFAGLTQLLADTERIERSLLPHVAPLPEFQRLETERKAADNPRKDPVKPTSAVGGTLAKIYLPPHLFARDKVGVTLHAGSNMVVTNGRVNKEQGEIVWKRTVIPFDANNAAADITQATPTLLYAAWTRAADGEQAARFGKTILSGSVLAEYVLWYRGLSDAERSAWDGAMKKLEPGDGLISEVSALRLPQDATIGRNDLSAVPRKLFEKALTKERQ